MAGINWSVENFVNSGGTPSRNAFSGYSKICKLLQLVDDSPITFSYHNKVRRDAIHKLYDAISKFHPSNEGETNDKVKQIRAVKEFKKQIEQFKVLDEIRVSELVDNMTRNPMPLISNTGGGLVREFSSGA